ncbi:MAG TPA: T9SS type A sorting domain-containing protein, partial [Rhodothermales bacterium]
GGARPGAESGVFRFLGRPTQSKPEFYIPAAGQGWTATQLDLGPRLGFAIAFGSGRPSNVGAMVVGIPAREGPGMVLRFSGGAGFRFSPAGTLEEPTTVSGSGFGTSVAVSLGILAVGAPGPPGSDGGSGTLYIFTPAGLLSTGHDRSFPARIDGVNMYPNPVRHRVNLRLSLFESGSVATTFYDIQGRKRRVHDHGILAPGIHDITLDTRALPPGVYAYTVEAAGEVVRGTIVVVR